MRKLIMLLALVIVVMIGNAKERTGYIKTGQTILDKPMAFTATDTIKTSETVNIIVYSEQQEPTKQDFYLTLGGATGSPSVAVTAYGKCFAGDTYVQIGSPVTWTSTSNNPVKIAAAAPNQYRYYKVALVHSGATGTAKITAFEMKLWLTGGLASAGTLTDGTMTINSGALANATTAAFSGRITGTGGATLTGAATNINASSNFATNIGTGTTNAAIAIGGGSNTVAVNSSAWDISTAGVVTGLGTVNGLTIANATPRLVTTATAAADSTIASSKLAAVEQFVTVTAGGAGRCITLPAAGATTVGLCIRGVVGANGFDLRVATADALTVKLNDVTGTAGAGVEAAIPATSSFQVICVSATEWVLTATDEKGAAITAIVPDPIEP